MSDSNDFLPIDNNTLQTDSSSFTHRYIQDKNTNTSGKCPADFCMINNLKILNGRKIGDLVGKYTCHHYNGSSTVDYITIETDLFDKVRYFQVLPLTLFSDHCPIIANMDIKSINSKSKNTDQKNHIKAPGYFKWDINSKQKILKYLNSNEFNKPLENLKQNLLSPNKNNSLNLAVTDLTNILIHFSKKMLKIKK